MIWLEKHSYVLSSYCKKKKFFGSSGAAVVYGSVRPAFIWQMMSHVSGNKKKRDFFLWTYFKKKL